MKKIVLGSATSNGLPLAVLNMLGITMYRDDGEALAKEFRRDGTRLRSIKLASCEIHADAWGIIAGALTNAIVLKSLAVSNTTFPVEKVTVLAGGLKKNKSLITLDLKKSMVCVQGLFQILDALSENERLESLDLQKCSIFKDAFNPTENWLNDLAVKLGATKGLKKLILSGNHISADIGTALARGLEKNTSLKWLDLKHNNLNDDAVKVLHTVLQKNKTLQYLDLQHNELSENGKALMRNLNSDKAPRTIVV